MLSLLYSTVLLYYICFCFVLSCTLLIGGNKEILLLLLLIYCVVICTIRYFSSSGAHINFLAIILKLLKIIWF